MKKNKRNNNRKYLITSILLMIALALLVTGCSGDKNAISADEQIKADAEEVGKLVAIASTHVLHEFIERIGGDEVTVLNLVPPGADAHDFEPTLKQMIEIANADIFAYNGAGFELWIDKLLEALEGDQNLHIINGTEGIPLLGSDDEHHDEHGRDEHRDEHDRDEHHDEHDKDEHHDDHDKDEQHDEHHEHGEYDPHVWLDPQLALMQAEKVLEGLRIRKPESAEYFEQNFNNLQGELEELDRAFVEGLKNFDKRTFVVSHAGYGYIAARYNLEQIAVTGIHPGSEPSNREILRIIDFLRETNNKHVFFETTVSNKTAKVIADEVGAKVLVLHPLENLTINDIENGETYFSLMYRNLENLKQAFAN